MRRDEWTFLVGFGMASFILGLRGVGAHSPGPAICIAVIMGTIGWAALEVSNQIIGRIALWRNRPDWIEPDPSLKREWR